MAKKNYAEKLRDPRWQKKRLEILNRDEFTCLACYSTTNELHVHHKTYRYGYEPWEYPNSVLQTLCKTCHYEEEQKKKKFFEMVERLLVTFDLNYYSLVSLFEKNYPFLNSNSNAEPNVEGLDG